MEPGELLAFTFETFGKRAAIGTSLQKTGSVMIDLAAKTGVEFSVFFVDTLFNYDETMELYDEIQSHYGIAIERLVPNPDDIEDLYQHYGQFPFFSSLGRARCCEIRKRLPLLEKLKDLDVEYYIPGHGDVCGRDYLDEQAAVVKEWIDVVRNALNSGWSPEEAQERISFLDRYAIDEEMKEWGELYEPF